MAPREYTFSDRMRMSSGVAESASVEEILLSQIPGAVAVYRANASDDRNGTDWWVETIGHDGENRISVDAKVRSVDYAKRGRDDLALETWSVVDESPGWTRDPRKATDYVLWLWMDTGRWCLVPFAMLCAVFVKSWQAWRSRYGAHRQRTPSNGRFSRDWCSECVFVPRLVVWRAIYERFGGAGGGSNGA